MKVSEIMTRNVITAEREETINSVLAKMKKHGFHQLPVVDGNNVIGMIELKNIVTKDVDIQKTKVDSLITSVPYVESGHDLQKVIELLLNSGSRALPVIEKGTLVGIVSETDVVKIAKEFIDEKKICGDVGVECEYVSKNDRVGKVKKMMFNKNISRVPVVESGTVLGIVGTLDMIKVIEGKERMKLSVKTKQQGAKEKIHVEKTSVESFIHPAVTLKENVPLEKALEFLQKNEEVIVINGDIKIITPKDVLELLVSGPKKQVYVQITGLHEESSEVIAEMDETTTRFVQKIGKMVDSVQFLFVHVEKHHELAGSLKKTKYSMRARISTPFGLIVSKSWGWKPIDVAQDVLNNLEREIMKHHERIQKHQRAKKSGQLRKLR